MFQNVLKFGYSCLDCFSDPLVNRYPIGLFFVVDGSVQIDPDSHPRRGTYKTEKGNFMPSFMSCTIPLMLGQDVPFLG